MDAARRVKMAEIKENFVSSWRGIPSPQPKINKSESAWDELWAPVVTPLPLR
jgi:hypothetical protein